MVYTYAAKNGRKYPYYLCLNAQRRGWAECPARSLPARGIEESVLRRIRDVRHGLIPAEWEQMERTSQVEAVRAVVERVGYDAHKQQILIRFRPDRTLTVAEGEAFDEL
jgi:site-specific DNA recombinase